MARSTRLLSLLLTVLPLLLILTSFILACVSSSQNDWSYRELYDPDASDLVSIGTEHRSPFANLNLASSPVNVTAPDGSITEQLIWTPVWTSTRAPGGLCDASAQGASRTDSAFFCQHLSFAARVLYAGCALLGAALVLVLGLTAVTVPAVLRGRHHHRRSRAGEPNHALASYLAVLLTLLSALGGFALLVGTVAAVHALSVLQFPNGDFFSTGLSGTGDPTEFNHGSAWMLGRSGGIAAAGAVLAGVAAYFVGFVWEGPRVGVVEVQREGNNMVAEEK